MIQGPIRAVLFDWAGVTVDYGSRAPAQAFVEVFRACGVDITFAEARQPMGKAKREHLAEIARMPRVARAWEERHGSPPAEADIQRLYDAFLPLQLAALERDTAVIPGVPEAIQRLRARGVKIGSTTGYTRLLMDVVVPRAAAGGYSPDVVVCADEVPAGRPAPWMNYKAAQELGVYPFAQILVVDDTPVGIEAGLHAGAITVAISQTGNALGLSAEEVATLSHDDLESRLAAIEADFHRIGAHHVIRSVAELPDLIEPN